VNDAILVFGAGGFVGQHLVHRLAQNGERVIAISRRSVDHVHPNVEIIIDELDMPEQFLPLLKRSRAVAYLAAASTPGSSAGHAMAELQKNLQPTIALLQALQFCPGTRLLYLSSGGSLYSATDKELASESSSICPRSYHGAGKIAAEYFIQAWCNQFEGAATVLRPSNLYGPGQPERKGFGIVPTCFGKIIRNERIDVWGDGFAIRDYLYIDDFITLCSNVLSRAMPPEMRIINAASGKGVTLNELFHAIESVTGRQLNRAYTASRKVDASRVVMDVDSARVHYNWLPMTPLEEGLRQTWAWFNTTQR
jgi:UDP-glucose 4-epimerase